MLCPSCGCDNADNARFCVNCGRSFAEGAVPAEAPQAVPEAAPAVSSKKNSDKTVLILALIAAVALLCSTQPKTVYCWITDVSALLLAFFCWKKYGFATKEMAIAFSVNAFRFIWLDFAQIIGARHSVYSTFSILSRITLYASLALYWLLLFSRSRKKELGIGFFFCSCFTSLYILWKFFKDANSNFSTVMFYLGWLAFMAVYFILFFADEECSLGVKNLFQGLKAKIASAPKAADKAAVSDPAGDYDICPVCGSKVAKESVFCTNCGNKKNPE